MAADATIAVSEGGLNTLLHDLLSAAHYAKSDTETYGPFSASYAVSIALSGGNVALVDLPKPLVRILDVNVNGSAGVSVGFDLGAILPHICIPPFRLCVPTPLGKICTPQFCPTWPNVTVPITLPLDINVSNDFGVKVTDGGATWDIILVIIPTSLEIDLTPMADAIVKAVQDAVDSELKKIPLIGNILAHLVDLVMGAFKGVLDALLKLLRELIHAAILASDLFAPTVPFKLISLAKTQILIPTDGTNANPDVSITLTKLGVTIADHELVAEAVIA